MENEHSELNADGKYGPGRGNRRGVALILVLLYITLAIGLLTLMAAGMGQLSRVARHERSSGTLRQMIDSGHAWAIANQGTWPTAGRHTRRRHAAHAQRPLVRRSNRTHRRPQSNRGGLCGDRHRDGDRRFHPAKNPHPPSYLPVSP